MILPTGCSPIPQSAILKKILHALSPILCYKKESNPEMTSPPRSPTCRRLIVTGDDFGLNSEVNEAVEALHEAGVLSQASLMVNERGVDEALRIARRHPRLCVGLHLSLCLGKARVPSKITNPHGDLPPSPARAGLLYAFRRRLRRDLEAEIAAQFEAFAALGLPAIYWDGHTHLHLHPTVFDLSLPYAQKYGFRVTRLVKEPGFAPLSLIFRGLSHAASRKLAKLHGRGVDRVFGLQQTGRITTPLFQQLLERVPEKGWTEIYLHPGAEPAPLDTAAIRCAMEQRGIVLGTAADLLESLVPAAA